MGAYKMIASEININYLVMFIIFLIFVAVLYFKTLIIVMNKKLNHDVFENMLMHQGYEYEINMPGGKIAVLTIKIKDLEKAKVKDEANIDKHDERITKLEDKDEKEKKEEDKKLSVTK
jgi:hypothetical protein